MGGDLTVSFLALIVIVISIALHEFAHAAMSTNLGDPIPKAQGRLTVNPVMHLDPFGFFFILMTVFTGFGLGWGRPVQTNPLYYENYRKGIILTAIAGPLMNIALATFGLGVAYALFLGGSQLNDIARIFLLLFISINMGLAIFNLLPIPPLDGGHVLQQLFPRARFVDEMSKFGILVLLGLLVFGVLGQILWGIRNAIFSLIALLLGNDFILFLMGNAF